ncbi:MAG: riboflavin synthase [Leptospira sp.]|nr:riboflavin synthase [Leptospira sp.]
MFTGLIEGKGRVVLVQETDGGRIIEIEYSWDDNDLRLGDSISINGACQTVTELNDNRERFKVYSSYKTLELTNLGELHLGEFVNLERSVTPNTRLGGHYVQGHVDGTGTITLSESRDGGKVQVFHIEYPNWMDRYIVTRGSIAIDGISLTVVSIPKENTLELVLIPETIQKTNAYTWKVGSIVNIEIDLIARYLEKMIPAK